MASTTEKKDAKGKTFYTATARVSENKKTVFSQSKNFPTKREAKEWGTITEANARSNRPWDIAPIGSILFPDAAKRYINDMHGAPREFGSTVIGAIKRIARHPVFINLSIEMVNSAHLMTFLKARSKEVLPSTANGDLSYIRGMLRHARVFWAIDIDLGYLEEVTLLAKHHKFISKSREREVRPTIAQLDEILAFYDRKKKRTTPANTTKIPMHVIIAFQIFSTRRIAETCRIEWADLDIPEKRILVRDMKDPKGSKGNNKWCALTDEAIAIIKAQPKTNKRIFPYNSRCCSSSFAKARDWARIDDLTLHDLRHEGTSRLFEIGLSIERVQMVTLHGSWKVLQRYTHLISLGKVDKYKGWAGLERATARHLNLVA